MAPSNPSLTIRNTNDDWHILNDMNQSTAIIHTIINNPLSKIREINPSAKFPLTPANVKEIALRHPCFLLQQVERYRHFSTIIIYSNEFSSATNRAANWKKWPENKQLNLSTTCYTNHKSRKWHQSVFESIPDRDDVITTIVQFMIQILHVFIAGSSCLL